MQNSSFKGSTWNLWDLHVHTPESYEQNFEGWESYINELGKLENVDVIGVTDYFTIDGYEKIKEYWKNGKLNNIKKILCNIELRLDTLVPSRSGGDKRLDFHVIFSDSVNCETIKNEFLNKIEFKMRGDPGIQIERRSLNKASINEVGAKVKQFNNEETGISNFKVGCKYISVSAEDISRELNKSCFHNKYLLVLAASDWDNIKWSDQGYLSRMIPLQLSHAVFCGQEKMINWLLGKHDISEEEIKKEVGCLKPSIHGSDAHDLENLCYPNNEKFCWIKSEITFEGLKQIVYEPDLRVRIQHENPTELETHPKIGSLSFYIPDNTKIKDETGEETPFCFKGEYDINFSNNLTCIIGGRGTGKSTLVHIIYRACQTSSKKRIHDINSPLKNITCDSKKLDESIDCNVPNQAEFFFQNDIENSAKNVETMTNLISTRLYKLSYIKEISLEDNKSRWDKQKNDIDKLIDAYDNISSINKNIEDIEKNIKTLKEQLNVIQSSKYKKLQQDIQSLNNNIADFNNYKKEYEELISYIKSLINQILSLDWDEKKGSGILLRLKNDLLKYKNELEERYQHSYNTYVHKDYESRLNSKKQELEDYLSNKGINEENIKDLSEANSYIRSYEEKIKKLEAEKSPYTEIYSQKDHILKNYRESYNHFVNSLSTVCSTLQEQITTRAISEKNIDFDIDRNDERLKEHLINFVKQNVNTDESIRHDVLSRILFEESKYENCILDKSYINYYVSNVSSQSKFKYLIQELFDDEECLEKFYLRLYKEYFDINSLYINTKVDGRYLKNTSFGERCSIVISIILVAGSSPIIIDQPEDHLDGNFITSVLVPLIRDIKKYRQILLVTRDANLVIGGDAELIHILEAYNDAFNITPTTIEDINNRNRYINILDGGPEAFYKREQKYNINMILS
jgi:ABC-type lipoprotein export system ATPase subunit